MFVLSAVLILAASNGAAAQAATKVAAVEPAKQVKICKVRKRTNSRFTKWVCESKADFDARNEQDSRNAAEQLNRPSINPQSSG